MKKLITILFISTALFSSCYYDKEDLLSGNGSCDTNGVTYVSTVLPLLQNNGCLSCHSGGAPSGNISLDTYNSVKTQALNGKLYGTISHAAGYSPMPQGGNKMSACSINRIKAWIGAGTSNN